MGRRYQAHQTKTNQAHKSPEKLPPPSHLPLLCFPSSKGRWTPGRGLESSYYRASSLHLKTSLFLPLLTWPGRGQRQALSQASQHIMHAGHKVQIQGEAEEDSSRVLPSPFLSTALLEGPRTLFTTLLI